MQGHRGIIGSHSEILDFDHGSTSANPITDPQIRWNNNVSNPADGRLADLMLSPNHLSNMYGSSAGQEQLSLGGWNSADPCSSGAQNVASYNEQKMEQGWSSSASARSVHGSRLEGRHCEPVDILSLDRNCPSVQSFNSNAASQNINLNAAYVSQVSEGPGCSKSGGSENQRTGQTNGADAQFLPSGSGSGGYLVDESDGRAGCSLDGRRKSCKRKAIEGSVGQCSISESSSFFQHSGNNGWPDLPAQIDARSSLNMSGPSEQASSRLRLGMSGSHALGIRDSSTAVRGESSSSRRNFRLRVNPSSQESVPATLFPSASSVQHSIVRTSHPQSQDLRFIPNDNYFDFGSSLATEDSTSQGQQVVFLAPALPQNVQSFRLSESSNVRPDNSSRSGDRNESSSVATARNLWDHQVFVPATEVRTSVRNSTVRSVNGGNISFPGNVASTSRAGLGSSAHPVAPPTWYSVNPPQRNSRRLAEYVRRALFSTSEAEPGGQSSTHSPLPGPIPSVEGTVLSSGMGSQGHHRSYPRSGTWIGRHGDGVVGIPYPLRTLSSGEGRSRMVVSEIRNVLDLMRRGENLRLEDVMILDQSVFFGVPDIHDRHREMRMDVDNMTYEELLALEERIGNVSTGLNEETILNRLKQKKFGKTDKTDVETEPCCVCQEEYNEGDAMGMLDCGHDFHTECIKQWLKIKNWCPICKMTGLST